MQVTHDIDTAATVPGAPIESIQQLTETVFAMASLQLAIDTAKAAMQAAVEQAKKEFHDATSADQASINAMLARVQEYCAAHRAELFGKRKSTRILQHELCYRVSTEVILPDAPEVMPAFIREVAEKCERLAAIPSAEGDPEGWQEGWRTAAAMLRSFLRQPPEEVNKEAVAAAMKTHGAWITAHTGIKLSTKDGFAVKFHFTPEARKS